MVQAYLPIGSRESGAASRETIGVLEQRNDILCQQGAGLYGFIHRTFLEYLCAEQILCRIEKKRDLQIDTPCETLICDHAEDESWQEIIRLLVAQLQPEDAAQVVDTLVKLRINRWLDHEGRDAAPALVPAIECLGEGRIRDRRHFKNVRLQIFEQGSEDSSWNVRQAAVQALDQHAGTDDQVRAQLIAWADEGGNLASFSFRRSSPLPSFCRSVSSRRPRSKPW